MLPSAIQGHSVYANTCLAHTHTRHVHVIYSRVTECGGLQNLLNKNPLVSSGIEAPSPGPARLPLLFLFFCRVHSFARESSRWSPKKFSLIFAYTEFRFTNWEKNEDVMNEPRPYNVKLGILQSISFIVAVASVFRSLPKSPICLVQKLKITLYPPACSAA